MTTEPSWQDAKPATPTTSAQDWPVVFTSSGSEYFRIAIVNFFLMLVTLGLYYPWAKVRRLRYFYSNTFVADHAFDFHGDPKKMLRGFLVVAALSITYSVAGKISPKAALTAFVLFALIWPMLFRASQRFRLANTSWRGLRFRFTGSTAGAYAAIFPMFIPGFLMLAVQMMLGPQLVEAGKPPDQQQIKLMMMLGIGVVLMLPLLVPMILALFKKYQHNHYVLGQEQTQLRAGVGSFYLLALKMIGVLLLASVVMMVLGGILAVVGGLGAAIFSGGSKPPNTGQLVMVTVFFSFAIYGLFLAAITPYVTSRLQNLIWNNTRSPRIGFKSDLRFWPLFGLTLKNWVLIALSLGFYLPFAKVAMARLRLQAVTVRMKRSPDELVSSIQASHHDATGDLAGDFLGIDFGL